MEYEIQELKKFIDSVCNKNIGKATKEMAFSHLAIIETEIEELRKIIRGGSFG